MVLDGIFLTIGVILSLASFACDEFVPAFLIFILGLVCFTFGLCILNDKKETKNTEYKYPKSEYNLEYEIISRGEQIDTIYVISKRE